MRTARRVAAGLLAVASAVALCTPASARPPSDPAGQRDGLDVYVGTLTGDQLEKLRKVGVDHDEATITTQPSGKVDVETVLSRRQAARLATEGVPLAPKQIDGKQASQVLREQAAAGWDAFRRTARRAASATSWRPPRPAIRA